MTIDEAVKLVKEVLALGVRKIAIDAMTNDNWSVSIYGLEDEEIGIIDAVWQIAEDIGYDWVDFEEGVVIQ